MDALEIMVATNCPDIGNANLCARATQSIPVLFLFVRRIARYAIKLKCVKRLSFMGDTHERGRRRESGRGENSARERSNLMRVFREDASIWLYLMNIAMQIYLQTIERFQLKHKYLISTVKSPSLDR